MRKVLITGAGGFIGRHLIGACLRKDWRVTGVGKSLSGQFNNHQEVFVLNKLVQELSESDVRNVDYVFHLAFKTSIPGGISNPTATSSENVGSSVHLLDLSAKARVKKFIFASTASIYGGNPIPWREDMPPDPKEPYSWQKLSCEYACRMWTKRYGLPTVNLRLFQVFGENQRKDTVIALFSKAKKDGLPLTLTNIGSDMNPKSCERDFVYAGDAAEAFISAALSNKTGAGEVINIGSGRATRIEDVAKLFGGEIKWIPRRDYEVEKQQADVTQTRSLLGWSSRVDVLEWLKGTDLNLI